MKEKQNEIDRRNFLKTVGAAGLTPAFAGVPLLAQGLASAESMAGPNEPEVEVKEQKTEFPQVPKRKLGKTGIEVPCLSLGGNQDLLENQIVLRAAPQWGVTYWDTANSYRGGNSELGIGRFLSKNPEARKTLLIATKASGAKTPAEIEERLGLSLKRMNTEYIDLFFGVHMLTDPAQLTDELKRWAEDAKKRKLIRFFGFTTHTNMDQNLSAAAKLDWIDMVITPYNFRLMQDEKLNAAIEACHKAGIGVIAIKTQGLRSQKGADTEEDKKLAEKFLQQGFTMAQAKIKAVLENKSISSACVGMWTVNDLRQDVAAALDKTSLSQADKQALAEYAQTTCSGYCAGCANICSSALPDTPYVSDIMRYLMYYNSYGDKTEARALFAQIPSNITNKLLSTDYSLAEACCPQHLQIGQLIAEAVSKLA